MDESTKLQKASADVQLVKKLVFDLYGLTVVKITELNGYDDRNFRIEVSQNIENGYINQIQDEGYVFKVINTLDSADVKRFEAQAKLMEFLVQHGITCPTPILTKGGQSFETVTLPTGIHRVILLTFIDGEILYKMSNHNNDTFFQVGSLAARIDTILQKFDHPAYHKPIEWCLSASPNVLNYLHAIDESRRCLVKDAIEHFKNKVLDIENSLEKGIIHGDINEQNLIMSNDVNGQLKAVIDFGDTHYCCFLYELALAVTYMIFLTNDLDTGGHVLAGYVSVRDISIREINLLKPCIMARFCQSLVMGAYSSLTDPNNEYILITAKKGWGILEKLSNIDDDVLVERWLAITRNYNGNINFNS